MPTYTFIDTKTEEVFDVLMKISDLDEYKKEYPHHERYIDQAPMLVSGFNQKASSGFNEVLSKVAEAHPNSPLADQHLRKSIKQVKTERAVREWRRKSSSVE